MTAAAQTGISSNAATTFAVVVLGALAFCAIFAALLAWGKPRHGGQPIYSSTFALLVSISLLTVLSMTAFMLSGFSEFGAVTATGIGALAGALSGQATRSSAERTRKDD